MLRLERVCKIYPTGEVLRDVTWEVKAGDRIGLVGVNGAGKSTQLRIIAGLEEPTSGSVIKQGDPRIVYLQQEFDVNLHRTVRQELFQAFGEAAEVLNEQTAVEQAMASEEAAECPVHLDGLIEKLGALQNRFEALHGYELDARIDKLLPTIGFSAVGAEALVGDYSGGWQMRIALGKILLQEPDLLLLDEPTNHLDVETIQWLETYLREQTVPQVVISHDRAFLDRVCNQIVETERGVSRCYLGNYSEHLEQKRLGLEASQSAFERQQKELASQQAYIDRFRASATRSTQAKSREKLLEKVDRLDAPIEGVSGPRFQFPPAPRSGRQIAVIENLTHSYGNNILFLGANLEVERGDRIAFVGPNGAGKSTLLRLIMGSEKPDEGSARLGEHNVIAGYFEQNQAEALDLTKTVIDTLFEAVPDWTQTQVRSLLGSFCFSNEAVFKEVGKLSGGEKARLALALMLLSPCNLLVLDEPTNHLDIPAKQMLESAYRGDYAYYQQKKQEELELLQTSEAEAEKEAKRAANRLKQKSKAESRRKRPG
ncbi:MAG: ATP-binding cassette domain-containing protein [Synechococcaceae bacterium WB5_2B_268]|nr:ATP-binding cassette domain-containing protein [Synechococcaceae bacterium WB5_2B_268]